MARTNKYASLNFNDIYDKKTTTTTNHRSSSSSSTAPNFNKTVLSNSRIHGNMLVLTLPSPKPFAPPPQPSPPPPPTAPPPDLPSIESDTISLRPLGRTGSPSPSPLPDLTVSVSPKTNKFVPPHLRPGFHGKEEKPEVQVNLRQSPLGSPVAEEGRSKSGGGYERSRPRSSGSNRPYSSG